MPPRDNIVLIKRENPKRVQLPNGRVFYAKYKRVGRAALPGNVRIQRKYKKRAANGGRRRKRRGQSGRGFKSFFKKALKLGKKALNNKTVRSIGRELIQNVPDAVEMLGSKVKNKRLKKILNSDITKTGIDLASGFAIDRLQ